MVTNECISTTLIDGEGDIFEEWLLGFREPVLHRIEMYQVSGSSQLLRALDVDFDPWLGDDLVDLLPIRKEVSRHIAVEFESCPFSARFRTPTFIQSEHGNRLS